MARTVEHNLSYARHLVRGNAIAGDVAWTRPDTPPVVLSHGFLGTRGTMLPLTRRFHRDGRIVFSYSHGPFQLQSLRASADQLTDQLRRLQDASGIERFDVVGFSMGGLATLHALKFLQAQRMIRRLVLLGVPTEGTPVGWAGIATLGLVSPSVWQVLPGSSFLRDLAEAPLPEDVHVRQIHAADDSFCPLPKPVAGVDPASDYLVLPGGHSSLVVAQPFYARTREFFDRPESPTVMGSPIKGAQ
jgi:pimeloyl-ACP methyl ester carboxylesterase